MQTILMSGVTSLEQAERLAKAQLNSDLGIVPVNPWSSDDPPRRLSIAPTSPDYHPSYMRVGIRFDGEERNDVQAYDADKGTLETTRRQRLSGVVEPYWRYPESRQQRRARERWEAKHRK